MGLLKQIFLFLVLAIPQYCSAKDMLAGHHQLLVVTTRDWDENQGSLQLYERTRDDLLWNPIGEPIAVVIGETGLAWGIGLHTKIFKLPYKKEGDRKSPAGIFSLGTAFGFASNSEMTHLKIEYLQLDEYTEAIDDPLSCYYNYIVNTREVASDWCSSEKMAREPLYKIGLAINHNFPNPQIGAGSAIFFHIWQDEHSGTAGCTAMSEKYLTAILSWLEGNKHPVLVQLPICAYHELKSEWDLP